MRVVASILVSDMQVLVAMQGGDRMAATQHTYRTSAETGDSSETQHLFTLETVT
jgi:hypothetical protein